MFVNDIGVLHPYNNEKIMQIHDNKLIAECTSYDFKEMLERKKVKSWLKSVSAFANTDGGSLFYGVNDEGEAFSAPVGLVFIRTMPSARWNIGQTSSYF